MMIIKKIFLIVICLLSIQTYAFNDKKAPKQVCNPSPFGTFCELQVYDKPTPKFSDYTYCGRTYVAITPKQREILNAYLYEHKNMILRFKLDDDFINGPCF